MSTSEEKKEDLKEISTLFGQLPGSKGDVRAKGYEGWVKFDSIQV